MNSPTGASQRGSQFEERNKLKKSLGCGSKGRVWSIRGWNLDPPHPNSPGQPPHPGWSVLSQIGVDCWLGFEGTHFAGYYSHHCQHIIIQNLPFRCCFNAMQHLLKLMKEYDQLLKLFLSCGPMHWTPMVQWSNQLWPCLPPPPLLHTQLTAKDDQLDSKTGRNFFTFHTLFT